MALIIDGYNLLHATDIFGPGPPTLENSRNALLDFLADALDPKQVRDAIIVFDATQAPPGLPKQLNHRGITVRFAPRENDADTLIEELIEDCQAPQALTVVSSDHRLHRAARRRRAKAIDSEVWYAEILRLQHARGASQEPASVKPPPPESELEVQYWLKQFEREKKPKREK